MTKSFKALQQSTPLFGSNGAYVEALYERYLEEPESVPTSWRRYFRDVSTGNGEDTPWPHRRRPPKPGAHERSTTAGGRIGNDQHPAEGGPSSEKQAAVSRLIQVYSLRGHQIAELDPLGLQARHTPAVLKLDYLGLDQSDFDQEFFTGGFAGTGHERMTLQEILRATEADLLRQDRRRVCTHFQGPRAALVT